MSEQAKKVINSVVLAGKLAELETNRGTCKVKINGAESEADYISLKGVIQFGDSGVESRRFETFVKSKTAKGDKSKLYDHVETFLENAIPMTKNSQAATNVELSGSLVANDYVGADEQLVETYKTSMQFIRNYSENKAKIDIEGYILAIREETVGEGKLTGRLRMDIVSMDYYNSALVLKNIVIPSNLAEPFKNTPYEVGQTAVFHIDYIPKINEASSVRSGGIGEQRSITEGKSYLEMVLVGAETPIDESEENALKKAFIKNLLKERQIKLDDVKNKGYLGNSGHSTSRSGFANSQAKNSQVKNSKPVNTVEDIDDDDLPF